MVKDIHAGSRLLDPVAPSTERRRHALLPGQRRGQRQRALEERRHRRRHRPGQGHQRRAPTARTHVLTAVGSTAVLLRQRRRPTARALEERRHVRPGPRWSRTSTRARRLNPGFLTNVGGKLYFSAYTSTYGIEMWQSDGTSGGTSLVKDIDVGTATPQPDELPAD